MINLQPTKCNICGGNVIYTSNDKVYGRKYGSGYCYLCANCGAYVGTHKPRPKQVLGLLANAEMRQLKMKCHALFDKHWSTKFEREGCYIQLAQEMGISIMDCHFGHFNLEQLKEAYKILQNWEADE